MGKRTVVRAILVPVLTVVLFACAAGKKEYDVGMQLSQAGKYMEAIAYLEQAIAKEPTNAQYKQDLADLKEALVNQYIAAASDALSATPVDIGSINKAKSQLAKAMDVDPAHPGVKGMAERIEVTEQGMISEIRDLYQKARGDMNTGQWDSAYFNLQQIQARFPNYEDSTLLIGQVSDEGGRHYLDEGRRLFEAEDFKGAIEMLNKALALNPGLMEAGDLLGQARENDSREYFEMAAKQAMADQKWNRAVEALEKAVAYDPQDAELQQRLERVRTQALAHSVDTARTLMEDGWLQRAFDAYEAATKNMDQPTDYKILLLRNDLAHHTKAVADQFKAEGRYGAARYWYDKIRGIEPQYPNIFYLVQEMEDRLKARVLKSIAVFDFSSPAGSQDAGIIVSSNLITYLFNNASGDIKILERENLKSILEEMKLGQIGIVSGETAKEMGRVYGIDVAIMGSVLLFKVDSSNSEGVKTVRYKIGTKIEDNIEYLNWKARHPHPTEKELAQAPPAKITQPEYAEKDYVVSNHKKVGFVQLSFRIVDVSTGENIEVRTLERKKTVEDDTSAGLPEAGVKFDPLSIPTDTELLQQMTEDVVAELGREVLNPLSNSEHVYFKNGETYLTRRNNLPAVESYMDAIFDEKLKQIQGSPMSAKALENIAEIFRNHRFDM